MKITLSEDAIGDRKFIDFHSPHSVVIHSLSVLFNWSLDDRKDLDNKDFAERLNKLLDARSDRPEFNTRRGVDGEYVYCITGYWQDEEYDDGVPLNFIKKFNKGSRYVSYIDTDEGTHGKETSLFAFPAVAYSKEELQAWIIWTRDRGPKRYPDEPERSKESLQAYFDVDSATDLMRKKLSGEIPWEFGPARINEPNFNLWHEKTRDQDANAWLAKWLD